jgi:hypothetical protein
MEVDKEEEIPDDRFYIVDDCISILDERKRHSWVRDDISNKCLICEKEFGLLRRRHHCRSCGGLFCWECSSTSITIPKFIESCPKPEYNPSSLRTKALETLGYNSKDERVCLICHKKIKNIMEISDLVKIFNNIVLDIPTYKKMACVSKSWNKIAKFYMSNFKEIQYYLPDHIYTEREKHMLWVNRKHLSGHSRWLIPLIKSIDWKNISVYNKKEVIELLYKPRTTSCTQLMCSQKCNESFTPEDSIICLYPYISEKEVRNYIFQSLSKASIEELLSYLPYLVYSIRFYYNKIKNKCQISDYLIHISSQNYIFLNYFYWELNIQMVDKEYKSIYHNIKLKLLDNVDRACSEENKEILMNSEGFFKNLCLLVEKNQNITSLKEIIRDHMLYKNYFENYPISLPIQPSQLTIGIDVDNIESKQSATRPVLIPFNCISKKGSDDFDNHTFAVLFKREDVRKDYIISKVILLMDLIIHRELGINMDLVHYAILPLDEKQGFVEIVPNCETVYNIHEKLKFTIQNYIIENNGDLPMEVLRERFVKSCAGYCVISYLLGIGDRHLDNIMITQDGHLFHIDFSYILGFDPKIITNSAFGGSEIRLTSDMIDMMGGFESKHYKRFKELCNTCYNCLRQHSNLFYILLSMLHYYKPSIDGHGVFNNRMIEKHIIDKFIPFESNYEAKIHINTKLSNNTHETLGTSISDLFHYYNKETSFTNFFKGILWK